jgi:hypothetical protein
MRGLAAVVLVAASSVSFVPARAADSVVAAYASSNVWLNDLEPPCDRDPDPPAEGLQEICLVVWFRWDLSVSRTIVGPRVKPRVHAARIQHTQFVLDPRQNRLYLLRPIDDPGKRELLKSDYLIVDVATDSCFRDAPQGLGGEAAKFHVEHTGNGDRYCLGR